MTKETLRSKDPEEAKARIRLDTYLDGNGSNDQIIGSDDTEQEERVREKAVKGIKKQYRIRDNGHE
jgi:hypothetical protein